MRKVYGDFLLKYGDDCTEAILDLDSSRDRAAIIIENRLGDFWLPRVINNFREKLGDAWNIYLMAPQGKFSPQDFSRLCKTIGFWESIREDNILMFQLDTIALRPWDKKWEEYDYVGAPCGVDTMNGGLSFRKKSAMIKALKEHPQGSDIEDVYFTDALRDLWAKLPNVFTAANFSLESFLGTDQPFGVHGTDKYYHTDETAKAALGV